MEKSCHIAVFIFGLTGGGATRRAVTLANGMAERGHSVDMVVLSPVGPSRRDLSSRVKLVTLDSLAIRLCERIPWRSRKNQVMVSQPALARYLRRERPEVLLSAANHVHLSAITARGIAGVPVRLVIRVSSHLSNSLLNKSRMTLLRWSRHRYGGADRAIAVSGGIAEDIIEHTTLTPRRVCTIYNPTFTPDIPERAKAPFDHPWFTQASPPVILAVGRLTGAKDFPTLLRAFARVRRRMHVKLVILGEGSLRRKLVGLSESLGVAEDVALPGGVENPYPWMSEASIFVLSLAWEGFPGVLIEAMACGCPVVSTDCLSGPAEILNNGEYGSLVPVGDDGALAEAIVSTLKSPGHTAERLKRAAEFSVDHSVDAYLEFMLRPTLK
ncbi:MAG: glycosyltransferase [Gammaproteobacteria bacterium]|nr:glycosyltransferase [Gammaproteobacteria bacterium]